MVSSSEQPLAIHAETLPAGTRTARAAEKEASNFVPLPNTYGPGLEGNDDQSSKASTFAEEEEDECEIVSSWDFPMFALLFNWIQICTFGILRLMWSLVSGHCVRQLLSSSDKSSSAREDLDDEKTIRGKWIQDYSSVIQSMIQFPAASAGPSVPIPVYAVPPALVALAILTMFALVVHPEGLTWVMLSNIRTYMMSLLDSSSTCWALVVRDYGLVGTVSASVSVAVVLILAVVLHRTFLSNSSTSDSSAREHPRQLAAAPEKKRKKRKGGKGKHTGEDPVSSSIPSFSGLAKVEEVLSDGVSESSSSSLLDTAMQDSCSADPGFQPCVEEKDDKSSMVKQQAKEGEDAWPTIGSIVAPVSQEEDSPSVLESVVSNEETEASGLATVDSATMSCDDLSCESFSAILPPPSKGRNKNRSRKLKQSKRRGQKQTKGAPKTNTTTSTPKGAVVAVSKGDHENEAQKVTPNSNQSQVDHSKKQGNAERSFESKGRGGAKGKLNLRAHGNGEGGMDHKSPKNPAPHKHRAPPRKARNNNARAIASSPRTIPASPAGSRSSMSVSNKSGRDTPVSPATQNLFSCELGASGWSMPVIPASSGAEKSPSLGYVPVSPYSQRPPNYGYPSPNPSLAPSDTSASLDSSCKMWDGTETMDQNSSILMPQGHPVRAPPGFAPPAPSFPCAAKRPMASAALPAATCSVPFTSGMYAPLRSGNAMESSFVSPSFGNPCHSTTGAMPFSLGGNAYQASSAGRSLVKENPFADDNYYDKTKGSDDAECRIEAELQELEELGGQMVGSVLDF